MRMTTLQELIQRTESLQHRAEDLQRALDQLAGELTRHREALAARLGTSNHLAVVVAPAAEDVEPEPTAAQDADAERRSLPRRRGNPIPVVIRRSVADAEHVPGWVIDRSPEGLCVLADQEVNVGALVSVRPTHHAEGLQWFPARVCNCRLERSAWILGCQFIEELSWDELRLFN
jgi:hypothetical protein